MQLLAVKGLKVYFHMPLYRSGRESVVSKAIDGVSFEIPHGETICLVGESGCGKTLTALSILGLVPSPPAMIQGGEILFKGKDLLKASEEELRSFRGNRISMIFQEPLTSLNPVFTVGDQIAEVLITHLDLSKAEARQRAVELLGSVGIPSPRERAKDYPHQLSGGLRQRVMIAMALACGPDLLIADEPTTALDVTIQAQILSLLTSLQKERGMSMLYITHDLSVVASIASQVYVMYAGLIVEQGPVDEIFRRPRHPYTQGLLASLPTREKRGKGLAGIPGSVPEPSRRPEGCPFHPRCRLRESSCKVKVPTMYDYGHDHLSRCPVVFKREGRG